MWLRSQSPQTGQFNSYDLAWNVRKLGLFKSQSPQTGQFNSYISCSPFPREKGWRSQSPQTGQFNSYAIRFEVWVPSEQKSLNPLKRVNSILTDPSRKVSKSLLQSLNPLKRVNSILTVEKVPKSRQLLMSQSPQTGQFNSYVQGWALPEFGAILDVSIPSNGSIQFLRLGISSFCSYD